MSGGLPTERQLAALEQRVLTRIRRRAAVRARVISGVSVAALVVGALALVHPAGGSLSSGSAAGGSSGGEKSAASAAGAVLCHTTSATSSPARRVPAPAHPTTASLAAACAPRATAQSGSPASGSTAGPRSLVVCRADGGGWEVFPSDGHPDTLCTRNGLLAG